MSAKRSRARGTKADHTVRATLLREWNQIVRHQPPAKRLAWLEAAQGLIAHGANQRKKLVAELVKLRTKLELVASSQPWMEEIWEGGSSYRFKRMRVSRAPLHFGFERFLGDLLWPCAQRGGGKPSKRATPLPALEMEDPIDCMSHAEARFYDRPPSPSAVAIRRIGHMKGREISEAEMRRRLIKRQERGAKLAGTKSMSPLEIFDSIATNGD